jgi:NDP-sugar pyrophosphorylase family protein
MKAMVLAAGFGTRLRPLTESQPKALVKVANIPMIEIVLSTLIKFGIRDIIINVHHFAGMIVDFLKEKDYFGINIEVSNEEEILGTGGGLKKAAYFFDDKPFLLYNVDVLCNINLSLLYDSHLASDSLATLVVQERQTRRYLLFDDENYLCGRSGPGFEDKHIVRSSAKKMRLFAFNGIHIISPRIFPLITEQGCFSIIDLYLKLAGEGEKIKGYSIKNEFWMDLGKPERIDAAMKIILNGVIET